MPEYTTENGCMSKQKTIALLILSFLIILLAFGIGFLLGKDASRTPIEIYTSS